MENDIAVLISTYNGEQYLDEQLKSLCEQSYQGFVVFIRDDGSSDKTCEIVNKYASEFKEKFKLLSDGDGRLGCAASFMSLLQVSNADYFMFCDQDDVWLPTKIAATRAKMKALESLHGASAPIMVFSDLKVVDKNLDVVADSFWKVEKLNPAISKNWKNLLAQNVVTGCTMMINRAGKRVCFPFVDTNIFHDQWVAVNISQKGHVGWLREATVLYRQHGSNVAGAKRFGLQYAIRKLLAVRDLWGFYGKMSYVFSQDVLAADLLRRKLIISVGRFL